MSPLELYGVVGGEDDIQVSTSRVGRGRMYRYVCKGLYLPSDGSGEMNTGGIGGGGKSAARLITAFQSCGTYMHLIKQGRGERIYVWNDVRMRKHDDGFNICIYVRG